jgi:DNA-binding NtrC family response regulator
MRDEDLNIRELVEFDSNGEIRFAGQHALIVDTIALGTLRKELIDNFGFTVTRAILSRFGFVQGWRLAEAMRAQFKWENDSDWIRSCGRIHVLEGMYSLAPHDPGPLSQEGSTLIASYEADQHLAHLGRSDNGVCWTVCGLLSGYLSRAVGKQIYILEERCIGRGDTTCHLFGRTREEWGDDRIDELRFFHSENLGDLLDTSLHGITKTLKKVEQKLLKKKRVLSRVAQDVEDPLGLVSQSDPMRRLVDLARRIASVDSTVLITGETGTGKERIARFVHEESGRCKGPFIAVNCGAIAETLLESELFGHVHGAFTGATHDRIGLFEAATGGTLLLDEIGEISPSMQVKLLRALQEREVRRVGENISRPFDVRVIAATNSELTEEIKAARFRRDLYYRLNIIELHVPPLRDRREDILPLARILLAEAAERLKRKVIGLSPRAADQLVRYDWPGNVRELENAMERAVAVTRSSRTELEDLPEEVRQAIPVTSKIGPVKPLADIEKDYILAVLEHNEGNQTRTAAQLGIGTATLYRKLKQYKTS